MLSHSQHHTHSRWSVIETKIYIFNTMRQRQDGRYFTDDVLKYIFVNEKVWILVKIPLKYVARGPINNIPPFVQIMAWRRPGDKPLSELMLVSVPTHICVTRPRRVNPLYAELLFERFNVIAVFMIPWHWTYCSWKLSFTHWGQNKMAQSCRLHFLEYFDSILTEFFLRV